ncbi:MAG: hypothetical protein U5N85_10505 [Arcicella sp.]|nr:hypothetical protein [Arcicella sp.]
MKKQIFTIILLLMGGVSTFGQFRLDGGTNSLRLQTDGIDRMYIAPNSATAPVLPGNVGIGTSTAPAKLTVAGDMALRKIVRETGSGGYNDYDRQEASIAIFENGGTIGGIQGGSQGQMLYVLCGYGTNQSALVIRHNSPLNPTANNRILTHTGADFTIAAGAGGILLIYDATKLRWRIVETPSSSGTAGWGLTGNAGTNPATQFIGTTDAQPLAFRTNNVETMRVLSTGNVGIGTSTPDTKLHVLSGGSAGVITPSSGTVATIESNSSTILSILTPATNQGSIYFGSPTSSSRGFLIYSHSVDKMFLGTGSANRIIIDGTGNMGIGTSTPDSKLDVAGDFRLSLKVTLNSGTYNNLNRNSASVIKALNGGTVTITGIAGGVDGMIVHIYATASTDIVLVDDSASSSSGNRIVTGNTGGDLTITAGGGATLIYDSDGYWRVIGNKG